MVAKEQGDRNGDAAVRAARARRSTSGSAAAWRGSWATSTTRSSCRATRRSPSFTVRDVALPGGVDRDRFQRRMKVLQAVDTWQRQMETGRRRRRSQAADTFYQKAYSLITAPHAKKAFDIDTEDPRLRDRYGRNSLGQGCLLARRLIEAGVRFVTVTDGGWDTHQNNFTALKNRLLPRLDAALSGLLQDLSDRGLLDSTLVVVLSDFGRTPKVNPSAGRDHWSTAGIALLAGGGIRPGTGRRPDQRPGRAADRGPLLHRGRGRDDLPLPGHPARHHPPHPRRPADPGQLRRPGDPRAGLRNAPTEARHRCTMQVGWLRTNRRRVLSHIIRLVPRNACQCCATSAIVRIPSTPC